ncbi:MAG: hypothetical protein AAF614_14995 [Chloroflexota bacterium]
MSDFDDPLAMLPDSKPTRRAKPKPQKKAAPKPKKAFVDPLDSVSKSTTAKATKSSTMRGQYWQRTLRLPPEFQDLTLEVHHATRARSIADTERWIYAMGLKAFFEDGKRPSYARTVARDIELPDFGDYL